MIINNNKNSIKYVLDCSIIDDYVNMLIVRKNILICKYINMKYIKYEIKNNMNVKKIQRNCINVLDNNRVFGESGFAEIHLLCFWGLWRWAEIPIMSCWGLWCGAEYTFFVFGD